MWNSNWLYRSSLSLFHRVRFHYMRYDSSLPLIFMKKGCKTAIKPAMICVIRQFCYTYSMLDSDLGGRGGGLFFSPLNITLCYVPWAPLECFIEAADIACIICKKWAAFLYTRKGVILTSPLSFKTFMRNLRCNLPWAPLEECCCNMIFFSETDNMMHFLCIMSILSL